MIVRSAIRELPLGRYEATVIATVAWPEVDVAEGKGMADVGLAAALAFSPVGIDRDIGGTLAVRPKTHMARFQASSDNAIRRIFVDGHEEVVTVDEDLQTVSMDLDRADVIVELASGSLLKFRRTRANTFEVLILQPALDLPDAAADNVTSIQDEWLKTVVQKHLAKDAGWGRAVAAGLVARLSAPVPGTSWRDVSVESSWPHQWVRNLSLQQRSALTKRALLVVNELKQTLQNLDDTLDPDDDEWCDQFGQWCRRRDDLEGIRVLLHWLQSAQALNDAVFDFDQVADRFVRSVPVCLVFEDEQLRRASLVDLDAWWVQTADPQA